MVVVAVGGMAVDDEKCEICLPKAITMCTQCTEGVCTGHKHICYYSGFCDVSLCLFAFLPVLSNGSSLQDSAICLQPYFMAWA